MRCSSSEEEFNPLEEEGEEWGEEVQGGGFPCLYLGSVSVGRSGEVDRLGLGIDKVAGTLTSSSVILPSGAPEQSAGPARRPTAEGPGAGTRPHLRPTRPQVAVHACDSSLKVQLPQHCQLWPAAGPATVLWLHRLPGGWREGLHVPCLPQVGWQCGKQGLNVTYNFIKDSPFPTARGKIMRTRCSVT